MIIQLLLFIFVHGINASQAPTKEEISAADSLALFNERFQDAERFSQVLFNPVQKQDNKTIANPYPTISTNEAVVENTFGANGLNVAPALLTQIKNFYFYLEYITKLELAAKIAAYAKKQNLNVISILETSSWRGLIDTLIKKVGGWQTVIANAQKEPAGDWTAVKNSLQAVTWQDIIKTSFWQSIIITPQLLINSSVWQDYLKYMITKTFKQDVVLTNAIYQTELEIFRYIPNIELAYYHDDFLQLRNSSEYYRLKLVLTDEIRLHLLRESADWKLFINKTGNQYDLKKIYEQSQNFQTGNFYQVLSLNEKFTLGDLTELALNKKLPIDAQYITQPLVQEKITCIAMIKNLQARTDYLFDQQRLAKTMDVLGNEKIIKPSPNFLFYRPDDYIYLEDLANIISVFQAKAQKPIEEKVGEQKVSADQVTVSAVLPTTGKNKVIVQDFGDWLSDRWSDLKSACDSQSVCKDSASMIADTAKAARDEAISVYYRASAEVIAGMDPKKAKELMEKSKKLQDKVKDEIGQATKDAENVVDDTANLAKEGVHIGAKYLGDAVGASMGTVLGKLGLDEKLGKDIGADITGAIDSSFALVIDYYADSTKIVIGGAGGLVQLSVEAVNIAATVVGDAVLAARSGDWSTLGEDALNGLKNLAYDTAATLMSVASLTAQFFIDQLRDLIKFTAYLVSALTDIAIMNYTAIFSAAAALFEAVGIDSAADAANSAKDWVQSHKRLIESGVTTAILLAVVVATDGVALPVIAFTVGPQAFDAIGAYQSDEQKNKEIADEKKLVENYGIFVNNNKTIEQRAEEAWQNELSGKFEAQITNQERDLGFYQNFITSYYENMKDQFSVYLGQALLPYVKPIQTITPPLLAADVGFIYGVKTDMLNLNQSQGFPLYSKGRQAFSEEIAVYPAPALGDEQKIASDTPRKFWFNQKETIVMPQSVNEVEIRFRPLYILGLCYIGIYLGVDPDLESLRNSGKANIDAAHLAKMLVFRKEGKTDSMKLKLYEHEGIGWSNKVINGPAFEIGQWYRMSLRIDDSNAQVAVWRDGDNKPSPQTIPVTKSTALLKSVGVISAGASIEYQLIKPTVTIQDTSNRPPLDMVPGPEMQREKTARSALNKKMNINFGNYKLEPADTIQLLKGHYIYMTQKNNVTDYFVFGTYDSSTGLVQNIGISPLNVETNAIINLVTDKAYDKMGKQWTIVNGVFDTFNKNYPLSDDLINAIQKNRKIYQATLMGPFTLGTITFQALSQDLINKGQYVYKSTAALQDTKGQPIKDSKGTTIYDYFVAVTTGDRGAKLIGAPYDPSVKTIRSLVTSLDHTVNVAQPTSSGIAQDQLLMRYQNKFGQLPKEIQDQITTAVAAYKQKTQQPDLTGGEVQTSQSQQTTDKDTHGKPDPNTGQTTKSLDLKPSQSQSSLEQRTEEGEGGEDPQFG